MDYAVIDGAEPEQVRKPSRSSSYRSFVAASREKKVVMVILCLGNFLAATFYACIAIFFPSYAASKGASESDVGLIFGIMQLVMFVFSFVWGLTIHNFGTKFMYVCGMMVAGCSAALMGFLEYCPNESFVAMCFLVRLVEGLGSSAVVTASFTIIADEFPTLVSTMFGACETFSGLGFMVGPIIGSGLYQAGGFKAPFLALGLVVVLIGFWGIYSLPPNKTVRGRDYGTFRTYMKIPGVLVTLLSVFTITFGMGFIDAGYSKHLKEFVADPTVLTLVFLIATAVYFFLGPLVGYLLDKTGRAWEFMLFGGIATALAYLFMGPSPIFPKAVRQLWVIIIGNILMGFGVAFQLIPPFGKNLKTAIEHGFPETIDTYGMVSGSLNSAISLGAFIGPTIGGALYDEYGFEWTLTGFSLMQIIVTCITAALFLWIRMRRHRSPSYDGIQSQPQSVEEPDEPFLLHR